MTQPTGNFIVGCYPSIRGRLDYKLYLPSSVKSGRKNSSLVIMLHGCHQDANDFARGTRMNRHADACDAYVAYPIQSVQANGARCWNWYEAAHQQRGFGEPARIAELTSHLLDSYPIDPDQVFVAGFSAGGAMAATMAVIYPELYAALGIHSGVPHGAARDFMSAMIAMQHGSMASYAAHPSHSKIPTIVFHGDQDNTVHSTHAAQFMNKAQQWPWVSDPHEERFTEVLPRQPGRYGCTRTVQLSEEKRIFSEQWMVHGGGHTWYGGDATGTYIDPNGPDAAQEMMRFFINRKS